MADTADKSTESISDTQMAIVPKEFFFDGMVLPVNVYLRIKAGSYLLIGKKNDKANFSSMHSFNNPQSSVYVKAIDNSSLIRFVTELTGKVVNQKSVPDAVKLKFLSGLVDGAIDEVQKSGFVTSGQVQKVSQLLMQMTQQSPLLDDLVKILETLPSQEAKHSMSTCMVALLLCEETDVRLPLAQEKIAIAALLHDIGLKQMPKAILDTPRHLWSPDDILAYEHHPIKSAEMLRDVKDLHSDILQIIVEHHENSQGTGFPKKIRDVKISHLGKILALSNCFADLLFRTHPDSKIYTPDEAIHYIEEILGQPFNKQTFLALKNIVNKKAMADKR